MNRWKRRIYRLLLCGLVLSLITLVTAGYAWHRMGELDKQHSRFLSCGKSVNGFLKNYTQAISEAHRHRDTAPLIALFADDYRSPARGLWRLGQPQNLGAVVRSTLQAEGTHDGDRDYLVGQFEEYLGGIVAIDDVKCKINLIEQAIPDDSAVLTVKFLLDGKDRDGRLFQDRFFYRWHLRQCGLPDGAKDWRIVTDTLVEGERVAGRGDAFVLLDPPSIGIDYAHSRDPKLDAHNPNIKLKFAVIEHSSGGVSAVDVDGDGRTDLFFADGKECRLYRNVGTDSGNVEFRDVTQEVGLGGIDQAHSALFCDVDNDGDRDLFVSRYLAPSRFFRNDGSSGFVDCSAEFGLDFVAPAVSACFFDFNNDGLCDLYVGNNGNAFEASPNIPFYATNGFANRLYQNVDGRRFVDVTAESGTGDTGWTLAVAASDFDGDGYVDLAVANDFGRKVLFRNNRDGTFSDVTKAAGVLDFSGGMGLAFGDMNFDGRPDLYTSNINSNQRWFGEEITLWQYGRNLLRSHALWNDFHDLGELYGLLGDDWKELGKMIGEGNSLFYNNGDGTFRELKDCGATRAGWSWGVALFDMDNDTDLDIYVANGWISGKLKDDL